MKDLIRKENLSLYDDYENFFDNFFGVKLPRRFQNIMSQDFNPSLDIVEKDSSFEITADIPGVEEKNIKVEIKNNYLTICGSKEKEESYTKGKIHRSERSYGSFFRSITLSDNIDKDHIKASFKNGTLKIEIPKKESEKARLIKIES